MLFAAERAENEQSRFWSLLLRTERKRSERTEKPTARSVFAAEPARSMFAADRARFVLFPTEAARSVLATDRGKTTTKILAVVVAANRMERIRTDRKARRILVILRGSQAVVSRAAVAAATATTAMAAMVKVPTVQWVPLVTVVVSRCVATMEECDRQTDRRRT